MQQTEGSLDFIIVSFVLLPLNAAAGSFANLMFSCVTIDCCECDNDDFDICLECWAIKGHGCRMKSKHSLWFAFLYDEDAKYKIQR
jgi:hypothetical protein